MYFYRGLQLLAYTKATNNKVFGTLNFYIYGKLQIQN